MSGSYGQSGPALELDYKRLNANEQAVLQVLDGKGYGRPRHWRLADLAAAAFGHLPSAQGNSWTRNSLRRLVRAGLVGRPADEPGVYVITRRGREVLTLGIGPVART